MTVEHQLVTIDEFEAFSAAHDDRRFELIAGEIVEHVPTEEHNLISGNLFVPLRAKAAYYLDNGAQQLWLVYPDKQMIEVLYPDGDFDIYRADETLPGGAVLPGFALPVSNVFAE